MESDDTDMAQKSPNILIVGAHPVVQGVRESYSNAGAEIISYPSVNVFMDKCTSEHLLGLEEIFIAEDYDAGKNMVQESIRILDYVANNHPGSMVRCHIMIHDSALLDLIRKGSFADKYSSKIEIIPFSEHTLWGERIFCPFFNMGGGAFPFPDRKPISYAEDKTVHIVIIGFNDMVQSLMEYAALVCHYPNYIRDHSLRTRITVIDEGVKEKCSVFLNTTPHIFANSYCRTIDLLSEPMGKELHRPKYEGEREDFVDVEWEFVNGNISSPLVREKFQLWSSSQNKYFTLILCEENYLKNISILRQLPSAIQENRVPVLLWVPDKYIANTLKNENVYPFGYKEVEYDISQSLLTMAKVVNYVYNCCYDFNYGEGKGSGEIYAPVEIDWNKVEAGWKKLTMPKRYSCIFNAMTVGLKMRSLGLENFDWKEFYGISAREIDLLARVEHNRWCVEELLLGYRPVDNKEQEEVEKDISRKDILKKSYIHYDLRAYDDLRPDSTGKNVNTYDICLSMAMPLIANSIGKRR